MRALLHIGHAQPDAAQLQQFLAHNWGALMENGVLYPSVEAEGVAHNLCSLIRTADQKPSHNTLIQAPHTALAHALWSAHPNGQDRPPHVVPPAFSALPYVVQQVKTIEAQIAQLKPETLVLSAPELALAAHYDTAAMDRMAALLKGYDVAIYCVLQRPDLHLPHVHHARIAAGEKLDTLAASMQNAYFDSVHFDYSKLLEPWQKSFPEAQIILRSPQDVAASGGLVRDFIKQAKVPVPTDLTLSDPEPTQADLLAWSEVLRRANHLTDDPSAQALLQDAITTTQTRRALPRDEQIDFFCSDLRAQMHEAFAPIHDQISQFHKDGTALFPDLDAMSISPALSLDQATSDSFKALRRSHWPLFQPAPLRGLLRALKQEILL
ncbi:hypothetical protein GFB49_14160 [Epibacterium sp. SM1979]|uniref:Uncharacterized protein n=1 Tax=Tritonibacter litoralis TaxID=2662264 RepID=A0A843YIH9_9RHOB|nr:hypothetical protein [Tritonibacter litoralis]MQQ09608.1 hypothetical protein [Tritonibacter litoralis]